jgi:hypothetical protein
MGKNQDLDPGLTTQIIFPRAQKQFFGLKFLNSLMRIRDPRWKKFGSEMENFGSEILDKHPESATLLIITSPSVRTYMTILLQVSGSGIPDSAGEVCEAEPGAEPAAGRLQGRNGR